METYAQPAEYARTMAAVLVAAGNAAPKALASRMAGTLALCGEQTVQANTATVFSQLLKGQDPLSDAQLLVCSHGGVPHTCFPMPLLPQGITAEVAPKCSEC